MSRRHHSHLPARAIVAAVAVLASISSGLAAAAPAPPPELVSRASGNGAPGNGPSAFPSVSGDGRLVAFRSDATNLVPDDTDTVKDVFVRDRRTGAVELVSRASGPAGAKGNRHSFNPRISANGRYVAFRSNSSTLVPGDEDRLEDIYVRDLQTDRTILVSRASGAPGAKANGGSFNPSISADGSRVAFRSEATNLSPEDLDTIPDIYVRDLRTNQTILVSRASGPGGAKGTGRSEFPVISGDGGDVVFRSEAPNLHPADPDLVEDIFVRDLATAETKLVSRAASDGPKGNDRSTFAALSFDGRTIAFDSLATNLHPDDPDPFADVFVRELGSGTVTLVSRADGAAGAKGSSGSSEPSISADGGRVTFHSVAPNLDPADSNSVRDVFSRDLRTFDTALLSRAATGEPTGSSHEPFISADGKHVVFGSDSDALSGADASGIADVFAVRVPKPPRCLGRRATALAAAGGLTRGTRGADVVVAGPGAERLKLGGGRDRVCAGGGDDRISTAGKSDRVRAGGGADRVKAGGGNDRLAGNGGRDRLDGGGGRDRCKGGGGKDRLKRCERARD